MLHYTDLRVSVIQAYGVFTQPSCILTWNFHVSSI